MTDPLTERQRQIADLVAAGYPDKVIAARLSISEETVAYHLQAIKKRLRLDPSRGLRAQVIEHVTRAAA